MIRAHQFIFPAAIASSLVLASFGYSVMAGAPKSNNSSGAQQTQEILLEGTELSSSQEKHGSGDDAIEDTSPCSLNPAFPDDISKWCTQIMRHASKNNLDPNLIAAVIWQESGGNPKAYSKSGAVGLMQVMPRDGIASTFQCINGPCFANRPTIKELEKPNFNIKFGSSMIAGLLQKHGDIREALKYYGPMNVGYYYADKVLNIYQAYGS